MVIDGFGAAMFMNHCCEPNCETREVHERIFVVALRDIAAGEELVYEYNLWDSDDATQDCFCGTPSCRGTMFSPRKSNVAPGWRKGARGTLDEEVNKGKRVTTSFLMRLNRALLELHADKEQFRLIVGLFGKHKPIDWRGASHAVPLP